MYRMGQMRHNIGHNRPSIGPHGIKSKNHKHKEKRGSLELMKTLQNLAAKEFSVADGLRPISIQGQQLYFDRPLPMF